ncbi:DsbA family protein [Poseidonocella sedimentorum]|uniref:Protein-disulfide isomerase n=1 Tax=Poseidonocella sedimentorum TaxID=871652 RepID=A0A1I6EFI9_9RHOB|nr:DsbA family protein [Poseidonocella sedimentorum]SFR16503.1 Protein-disulfide isomerase [Poseidonocella sedimentorum]
MSRTLMLAAALAGVAAFGAFRIANTPSETAGIEAYYPGAAHAQDGALDPADVVEMTLGDPDAPVTVVEYASFTCPHCANFHAVNYEKLKAEYIDTGKVHFIYREVYFDLPGLWASMVARCGGDMRFFGIADMIYERQKDWLGSGDRAEIEQELRKIGKLAGLGEDELASCMTDEAKARQLVAWYQQNAEKEGINSTPSFVIDGQLYSNMAWDEFSSVLDDKIGG